MIMTVWSALRPQSESGPAGAAEAQTDRDSDTQVIIVKDRKQ